MNTVTSLSAEGPLNGLRWIVQPWPGLVLGCKFEITMATNYMPEGICG